MASRGLCSLGEPDLMTDAARLLFGEEPTEPDLERATAAPARAPTLLLGGEGRSDRTPILETRRRG
jgi:hypothetical protein